MLLLLLLLLVMGMVVVALELVLEAPVDVFAMFLIAFAAHEKCAHA